MKTADVLGCQGDVAFLRIDEIPPDARLLKQADEYVVAHSETGHHHVARSRVGDLRFYETQDPLIAYLEFRGGDQTIEHLRSFDTHETLALLDRAQQARDKAGEVLEEWQRFKVIRQRQATPEGWIRATD